MHDQEIKASQDAHQNASDSSSASNSASRGDTKTSSLQNDASGSTSSSAMVFKDLKQLNSHHFVLTLDFKSSQDKTLVNIFQGANNAVTSQSSFPIDGLVCVTPVDPAPAQ
jgi:hypothetical protein